MAETARGLSGPPPVLEVRGLSVSYRLGGIRPRTVQAVRGVSLELARGEAVGLVGESGCGKTSLARALVGLEPASGTLLLDGSPLAARRSREQARRIQIVFQDPYASLNPRMTVGRALAEMLRVHRLRERGQVVGRVAELAELVGLPPRALQARPAALSGGQRQRAAIARALALEPDVLVADEPTTALDVSVQALILDLFARLRGSLGLGLLLITHNLSVVAALCDRVAVMYLGEIVEQAPARTLLTDPRHPYTRRLLSAVPEISTGQHGASQHGASQHGASQHGASRPGQLAALSGDPPDPARIPAGCPFHPRCSERTEHCTVVPPRLAARPDSLDGARPGAHLAACHYVWQPTAVPEHRKEEP